MSESKFETVSSCVDNYLQQDESFDDIIKESELSDTWGRYQLIGDIMRDEVPHNIDLDLSNKIALAIENEPTVLAPKQSTNKTSSIKGRVVSLMKPFGQLAIAASAAGLMVLGVQQNNVVNIDDVAPIQNIQTNPLMGIAEPVSYNYQQSSQISPKQAYMEQQRRLQALLADHNQQIKLTAVKADNSSSLVDEVAESDTKTDKVENLDK